MMTRIPVAGAVWGTMQYLIGFQRLGYDVYYVEAHARTPTMLMERSDDDSSAKAAAFIDQVMRRFDLGDRWAFHALHDDGRCYGMTESKLNELYDSAHLIVNFHGATVPLPEHSATGRLIYLETDPVELEIELYNNDHNAFEFLKPHVAFFTWGLNYGNSDCRVPLPDQFHFIPTFPVVVPELWNGRSVSPGDCYTTIGNWRQSGKVKFNGDTYYWSKHFEFLKFIDVPSLTEQRFELALSRTSHTEEEKQRLENKGWRVRDSLSFSSDLDAYRNYIESSQGEFTVAKDQNIRLRSGWFSERSAQYLAAGRPVITQETGFSNALPTGEGLFSFSTIDDILAAVDAVNSDYTRHSNAAREIAHHYFNYESVLPRLLEMTDT
jgi:hypothetical protein